MPHCQCGVFNIWTLTAWAFLYLTLGHDCPNFTAKKFKQQKSTIYAKKLQKAFQFWRKTAQLWVKRGQTSGQKARNVKTR